MSVQNMSVVFLGFTVDDSIADDIARQSSVLPTQTHIFAWNLIDSIKTSGATTSLLSALPVPNFPEYPRILIRRSTVRQHGTSGITMSFINLLILKHLTRMLSCLLTGVRFIRSRNPDLILVHGVHTPFLLFARLIKYVYRIPICVVMTDPPGVVRHVDGPLARFLKRVDKNVVRLLIKGFNGSICLTPALAEDYAPRVPSLILEGFSKSSPERLRSTASGKHDEQFIIAYAGGMSTQYGVANLVMAFMANSDPNLRLHLFGKGPLDEWVGEQCLADSRIKQLGFVSHDELIGRLQDVALLVNPRPAAQEFVRYSFPSKLLEYMTLGVPVVSTRLEGIPSEYWSYLEVAEDDGVNGLSHAINDVIGDYQSAAKRAAEGKVYLLETRSIEAQGRRIAEFFETIR